MNRIEALANNLKGQGKKALIGYLMGGEFSDTQTLEIMHSGVDSGLDMIELGFPFSDPAADGATIQNSAKKSLANGTKIHDIFAITSAFRTKDTKTPLILMGYYNIVMQYSEEAFLRSCVTSGIDGLIIVDLPIEESQNFENLAQEQGIILVQIVSILTPKARFIEIQSRAKGFVYLVSTLGVTGQKSPMIERIQQYIMNVDPKLPIYIGFGINSVQSATDISKECDGIIVGSHLIKVLNTHGIKEFSRLVKKIKANI